MIYSGQLLERGGISVVEIWDMFFNLFCVTIYKIKPLYILEY